MTTLSTNKKQAFGSTRSIQTFTITRPTLSGTLTQAHTSYWVDVENLRLIFRGLTLSEKDTIIDNFEDNPGKSFNITDTDNDLRWYGMITSPIEINQITNRLNADETCELYEISFVFRGKLI